MSPNLTILTKYVIMQNRLPRGQKKRFYFNVLKREKKRIIKRAEINRKKVREHGEIEEDSCILIDFII